MSRDKGSWKIPSDLYLGVFGVQPSLPLLQARLSKLREEHARMRDEAALSAAETAASPLRQRAVELEELGAHHSRLAGAVKQCEVSALLRKTREGWNCRFQKTPRTEGWDKVQAVSTQGSRHLFQRFSNMPSVK